MSFEGASNKVGLQIVPLHMAIFATDSPVFLLHILKLPFLGRAGPIVMLLDAAKHPYQLREYSTSEWRSFREEIRPFVPYANLPVLQVNDRFYAQTYPILRYLTKKLRTYGGEELEVDQLMQLEQTADIAAEWRTAFTRHLYAGETERLNLKRYAVGVVGYMQGPFVIDRITWVDFVIYCLVKDCIADNWTLLGDDGVASKLRQLVSAIESL